MRILVAVASKHGSTREIGDAVAGALGESGHDVDVHDAEAAPAPDAYDAVVLGSASYLGRWLEPARGYAELHAAMLAAKPVWLFTSGPIGEPLRPDEDDAVDVDEIVTATRPREHRLFPGKLDKKVLGLGERAMVAALRVGEGDFRDWDEIRGWARGIAGELSASI